MAGSDELALDWLVNNRKTDPKRSAQAMEKLGVDSRDVDAWEWTQTNESDERSVDVRNKLFTKLTEGRRPTDLTKGFPKVERFMIKTLADEGDVKAIGSYMKDRGFITRVKGGEVQARRPKDKDYVNIEPTDIDLFDFSGWAKEAVQDVTDVSRELVEGGIVTLTTGAKLTGARLGGFAGLAGTSAASGLTMAGLEVGRQKLGQFLGVRGGDRPDLVKEQGLIGLTLPGLTGVAGKALEGFGNVFGKLIGKFQRFAKKPEAETIQKGAEALGAKATPAQLFESPGIQKLEESIVKSGDFQLGGLISGLPKQVETNRRAIIKEAEALVKGRSFREGFDVGREVGKELVEQTKLKIAPAEKLYNEVIKDLGKVKANKSALKKSISNLEHRFRFSDDATKVISSFKNKLESVKSLEDLKLFRTSVLDEVAPTASKNTRIAANDIYAAATEARNDSFKVAIRDLKGRFLPAKKAEILGKIKEADSIYKSAVKDVENAILAPGKQLKLSPKQTVKEFLGKTPEIKRINKILDTGDPKKIQQLRKAYPSVFDKLKKQKIEDIAKKAELNGEINPKRLSNIITKLPLRTQVLLFGAKGTRHAKALKDYLDSLPQPFNTSNTSNMNSFIKILNPLEQASSVARASLLEIMVNTQLGKSLVQRVGRGIASPLVKGAVVSGRSLLLPEKTPEGFIRVPEGEK